MVYTCTSKVHKRSRARSHLSINASYRLLLQWGGRQTCLRCTRLETLIIDDSYFKLGCLLNFGVPPPVPPHPPCIPHLSHPSIALPSCCRLKHIRFGSSKGRGNERGLIIITETGAGAGAGEALMRGGEAPPSFKSESLHCIRMYWSSNDIFRVQQLTCRKCATASGAEF